MAFLIPKRRFHNDTKTNVYLSVLPDGTFSNQKYQFGGPWNGKCYISWPFEYLTDICYIFWLFGTFCGHLVFTYFPILV
jgi:hypothetical protein